MFWKKRHHYKYLLFLISSLVFFTYPASYAHEKCGAILLSPRNGTSSVTLKLSISSCEELANAVEVHISMPNNLTYIGDKKLAENLFKLPTDTFGGEITLRYVSLSDMSGVTDIALLHFKKTGAGEDMPQILPSSLLLLADGNGTNIFSMN